MSSAPIVIVRTLVYNHAPYLHDYFKGILMQQTDYPFEVVIHDDASTDGSADIIREYAARYPELIKPIYEEENLYRRHDGSLGKVMYEACRHAKYCLLCEGDDYWTDPHKLQKQISWLETHPECSMTCTNGDILTPEGLFDTANAPQLYCCDSEDRDLTTEEVITRGGQYIHTASIAFRNGVCNSYPESVIRYRHVGDYPLQIMGSLHGTVHYFAKKSVVYRWNTPGSWTARNIGDISEAAIRRHDDELRMLEAFDEYSEGKFRKAFRDTQWMRVAYLLEKFPAQRAQILSILGWAITPARFSAWLPQASSPAKRIAAALRRWLCAPHTAYTANGNTTVLLPAALRFFITRHEDCFKLGLGRRHLLSLYRHPERDELRLCGKRLFSRPRA